jgi:acyl carrier protein
VAKKKQESIEQAMMTHILLLQLKADITDQMLAPLWKAAHALPQHIPCLLAVSAGENQSTHHRGFTHGILLHFIDEQHLRDGLTHSTYQRLREAVQSLCEQTITFDIQEHVPFPAASQQAPSSRITTSSAKHPQEEILAPSPDLPTLHSRKMADLIRKYPVKTLHPRLKQIVVEQFDVDEKDVQPGTSLIEDLNADSLDLVEYIMTLEASFRIDISDDDAVMLATLGETQAYLMERGVLEND